MILRVLVASLLAGSVHAQTLTWSAPTEDVDGNPIGLSALYYKLYYSYDDATYNFASDHMETFADLTGAPAACYYLYVTAVRTDTNPELESSPSESAFVCLGQENVDRTPNPPENLQSQ